MAKVNPFMFSTKFYDWETGLLYYGYRFYNPSTGRWPSRDPIKDPTGLNLYGYVDNDPSDYFDTDGQDKSGRPPPTQPGPGGHGGGPGPGTGGGYNPAPPTTEIPNPTGHGFIIFDSGVSGYVGGGGGAGTQTIRYDNGNVVSYGYVQYGVGCGGKGGGFGCGEVVNVFKPSDYAGVFVNGSAGYGAGATVSTGFGGVCAYTAGGGVGGVSVTAQWYWIVTASK
jgi:RHS repeat-associated protein